MKKLLIANRGEIAIRIIRAAAELDMQTVAVYAADDAHALHVSKADEALPLQGTGVAAYLDGEQLIAQAQATHCDAIHPGYGFLSENADFAQRCTEAGIRFVGPRPQLLTLFGDKRSYVINSHHLELLFGEGLALILVSPIFIRRSFVALALVRNSQVAFRSYLDRQANLKTDSL